MPPLLRHSVLNLEYRPFDEDLAEVFDVFQSAGLIGAVDFLLLLDAFVGLPGFLDIVPVPFLIEGVRSKELFLGEDRVGRGDGIEKVLQQSALLGDLARIAGGRIIKKDFLLALEKLDVVQKGRLLRVLVVLEKIGEFFLLLIVLEREGYGEAATDGEIVAGVEQDLVGVIAQVGRKLDPADDPIVLFVVFKLRKSSFGIRSQIGDADFRQEAR